jgi:hypothetical protein
MKSTNARLQSEYVKARAFTSFLRCGKKAYSGNLGVQEKEGEKRNAVRGQSVVAGVR